MCSPPYGKVNANAPEWKFCCVLLGRLIKMAPDAQDRSSWRQSASRGSPGTLWSQSLGPMQVLDRLLSAYKPSPFVSLIPQFHPRERLSRASRSKRALNCSRETVAPAEVRQAAPIHARRSSSPVFEKSWADSDSTSRRRSGSARARKRRTLAALLLRCGGNRCAEGEAGRPRRQTVVNPLYVQPGKP